MASVFLSYDRGDAERARKIARALERAGNSVWWDRQIKSGAQYGREIDEAIKRADAVVVLWSEQSIDSAWVRDEAAAGRDSGKLVPARIDAVDPPLGFRQYQTTDLTSWKGRRTPQFDEMLEAISSLPARSQAPVAQPGPSEPRMQAKRSSGRSVALMTLLALIAFIAVGLVAWMQMRRSSSMPVVAVTAADPSPGSAALARDLLVHLGTLQAARPNFIELVSAGDRKRPTLILQVGRSGGDRAAEANLALTEARNRSLLWSRDFRDPNGNVGDLRQQLAYAAAGTLRCALGALDPAAGRLTRASVKTYVNACAALPDAPSSDAAALIPDLQQLVKEAPRFGGAWSQLLLAETAVATDPSRLDSEALKPGLARRIIEARRLHPSLAEAYLAEYALTPNRNFLGRSRILDQGIERNPDNPQLRYARHIFLDGVGRSGDALHDARRAVELDPLSPAMREGYIMSLAFAGRLDEALVELEEAERLWPGATSLRSARYTLHLRAGDPREALRLLRAGALQHVPTEWMRVQETLIEARIDRSPEKVNKAIETATTTYHRIPQAISLLSQTLVEFDREEELFPILINWRRGDIVTWVTEVLFRPKFSDFHKDLRFMQVVKRLGLLDYWRASGKWPDFCLRADLPYDCKVEAAKLAA